MVKYNFRFAKNRSAGAHELKTLCEKNNMGCTIIPEIVVMDDGERVCVSSTKIRELVSEGKAEKIEQTLFN